MKNSGEWQEEPESGISDWVTTDGSFAKGGLSKCLRNLYLRSLGKANSRKGDGTLAAAAPQSQEPRDIFVYDPEVPVYAPGGPLALSGPHDQAEMELGNNLLVYTSEPLGKRPADLRPSPRDPLRHHVCRECRLHSEAGARASRRARAVRLHGNCAFVIRF